MKKYIIYIVVILLSACSKDDELPAGLRAGGFQLADNKKQNVVIKEMAESSIPYEIDDEGTVWYMQKDVAEVRKLIRESKSDNRDTQYNFESEIAVDDFHLGLYKKKFDAEGIPYNVKLRGSNYNIVWRVAYADKVDQIVEDVGFEFYQSFKNN